MAVKLSARMLALADFVSPGVRLADVGADHGYISVFLCQTGKIPGAIAMDINRGPLRRAEAHVAEYGLQGNIQTRLSDGLFALAPGEADTILIAGMGGALVKRILSEGAAVLETNPELVLQPQSEIPSVRAFLREIGYVIVDEDCVLEDGKFYFLMKARRFKNLEPVWPGREVCQPPDSCKMGIEEKRPCAGNGGDIETRERDVLKPGQTRLEDAFGPVLLQKKHPVLRLFLERELAVAEGIRKKLTKQMDILASAEMAQKIAEKQSLNSEEGPGVDGKKAGTDLPTCTSDPSDVKKRKLEQRLQELKGKQSLLEEALGLYGGKEIGYGYYIEHSGAGAAVSGRDDLSGNRAGISKRV